MPTSRSIRSRVARTAVLFASLLTSFTVAQGNALASNRAHHGANAHAASISGPAEGMFDNCDLNSQLSTCEQRLNVMAQGGLKVVVMAVGYNTEPNLQAYAAYAQSVGMSVMWELNDPGFWGGAWSGSSAANDFSQFAQACGCTSAHGVLQTMISFLAALPGTYGYYAADDLSIQPGQRAGLTSYVNTLKAIDPNHMVMVGANAGQGQSNASSGAVIGNEIYPETNQNLQNMTTNEATWDALQQEITQAQASATRNGQGSAFILQAFTFGDNLSDGQAVGVCTAAMSQQQCYDKLLYPNQQVQEELRNEVLQHSHAKLILWYSFEQTYGQAGTDTYSIYPTGSLASSRWAAFTRAINSPQPQPQATAASGKRANDRQAEAHARSGARHRTTRRQHRRSRQHHARKAHQRH